LYGSDEFDVLRAAQRLDLLQQGGYGNAQPGNHHAPAFDAAQAVDALFQRRQFQDVLDAQCLRLPYQAVDAERPWPHAQAVCGSRRIFLVGAEFVIVVVGRHMFEWRRCLAGRIAARPAGPKRAVSGRKDAGQSDTGGQTQKLAAALEQAAGRDFRGANIVGAADQHGCSRF
jgi:hypothetical protein